jgi:hypothetical protein
MLSPRMKSGIEIFVILLSSVTASVASDATNQLVSAQPDYKVVVYYERMIPVSQEVAQKIQTDLLEMMKTAAYNSRAPRHGWRQTTVPELTTGYRNVITSEKYVLATWAHPQKVQTVGGEVTTCETILALEIPGAWMYNVDEEGRLIAHWKV